MRAAVSSSSTGNDTPSIAKLMDLWNSSGGTPDLRGILATDARLRFLRQIANIESISLDNLRIRVTQITMNPVTKDSDGFVQKFFNIRDADLRDANKLYVYWSTCVHSISGDRFLLLFRVVKTPSVVAFLGDDHWLFEYIAIGVASTVDRSLQELDGGLSEVLLQSRSQEKQL